MGEYLISAIQTHDIVIIFIILIVILFLLLASSEIIERKKKSVDGIIVNINKTEDYNKKEYSLNHNVPLYDFLEKAKEFDKPGAKFAIVSVDIKIKEREKPFTLEKIFNADAIPEINSEVNLEVIKLKRHFILLGFEVKENKNGSI